MSLLGTARHILYADHFVSCHKAEYEHRNQRGIALIAATVFGVMSLLNLRQHSYAMLATTGASCVFLLIGYLVSRYQNYSVFLRIIFYLIFIAVFTSYTVMGGNDGFAVLWLITATYAVMIAIDFKAGFIIGFYYLVLLLLTFIGPLSFLLQYDYDKTFLLRYPFLYAANFVFATYIIVRIRLYQYELLMKQQELERLSTIDLSTGLMNRNYFIRSEQSFSYDGLRALLAVFIDVNGLHEINNREGHNAGDKMLCTIADLCTNYFCEHSVYRMGGDEFLVLCQNAEESAVLRAVQKLYDAVEAAGYSISYGIEVQNSNFDLNMIVKNADEKMMAFKREYYRSTNREKR